MGPSFNKRSIFISSAGVKNFILCGLLCCPSFSLLAVNDDTAANPAKLKGDDLSST